MVSICTGAFALGHAGLIDGRHVTTHWQNALQLARQFPLAGSNSTVSIFATQPCDIGGRDGGYRCRACARGEITVRGLRLRGEAARGVCAAPWRPVAIQPY